MKKVLFLLFASVLLVACSKSYEDKRNDYIDFFKSATEDINKAETMKDLLDIFKDLKKEAEKKENQVDEEEKKKEISGMKEKM